MLYQLQYIDDVFIICSNNVVHAVSFLVCFFWCTKLCQGAVKYAIALKPLYKCLLPSSSVLLCPHARLWWLWFLCMVSVRHDAAMFLHVFFLLLA